MNNIERAISKLTLGEAISHEILTMHPLVRSVSFQKDYVTLDEALKQGLARVTEVSESGSVPQLLFRNQGDQAVFLLDGEELVGAKQNRILNITILAPARKDIEIPVSCVEAGRWRHTSDEFRCAPRAQFSESRARRVASVTESLRSYDQARSNQGEVWDDIGVKMERMGSRSDTSAQGQIFEDHASRLDEYVEALRSVPGQVGAVFSIRGRATGLELFDSDETAGLLLPKIVRSYALDAIDPGYRQRNPEETGSLERLLARAAEADFTRHESVGEGMDLRFVAEAGIAGGALLARGRIVHICAFAISTRRHRTRGGSYGVSASARRRYRNVA